MMKKITLSVRLLVRSKGQKHIFPTIVEDQYSNYPGVRVHQNK